jgi:hypothetical protein
MPITNHRAATLAIQRKFGLARSPAWDDVAKAFLAKHPHCAACGETSRLNVHHKFPFHYVVLCGRPDLELDTRNLMTLCVRPDCQHHLLLGHLDDYESYNRQVAKFVKTGSGRTAAQIRGDTAWQKARAAKPKHLDLMTQAEKDNFKRLLDRLFKPKPAMMTKAVQARATLCHGRAVLAVSFGGA